MVASLATATIRGNKEMDYASTRDPPNIITSPVMCRAAARPAGENA
jgi:hypothetical protein